MVLFREDEKRIREMEKQEKLAKRTKFGFWIRRLFKIGMVLGIIFVCSLGLLAGLGGSHEALKKGIEDYLTQATGLQAEVGAFNNMGFFPDLELDAERIALRKSNEGAPVVIIEKVRFSAGFFDLMMSRQRIDYLNIDNIFVAPGVIGDQELVIDSISLAEKEGANEAALTLGGHYGDKKIAFNMEMEHNGRVFNLPESSAFKIDFGDFNVQGKTERVKWGGVKLQIDTLGMLENILSGTLEIKKKFSKKHVAADFKFGDSQLQANIKISPEYIKGAIDFPVLVLDDLAMLAKLNGFVQSLPKKPHSDLIDFHGWNADLDIAAKDLRVSKGSLGNLGLNFELKDQLAKLSLDGAINGGKLGGIMTLDAAALPAKLKIRTALQKWDYGQYQKLAFGRENVSGTANIDIALNASGKTYANLLHNTKGEAALIAGRGEMASSALNIWGGGLVNALLPSLDSSSQTTLNCIIANFKIEDGIARPDPLFVDTQRVMVIGEGEIDFFKNNIDIKLEPKAKDPAFLDIATAVNITGPILSPSIGADTFSLFEKIGGLALGFINPAFLVLSMTDMGVTEDHPCYEFIGKPKTEEKTQEEPEEKVEPKKEFNE